MEVGSMLSIKKDLKNKLTKKDYLLYLLNRNSFILISPLIIISLVVVCIFMIKKDGFSFNDLLYLLPTLLFFLSYIQINNAVTKTVKMNDSIQSLNVILDDKKYTEITSNGTNALDYSKFYAYYENKDYYYLYVDKVNALILPKREFNSEEIDTINTYFSSSMRKISALNIRTISGIIFSIGLIACIAILLFSMI